MYRCLLNNRTDYPWLRIDVRVICDTRNITLHGNPMGFYPIGILIFFELLMGSQDDDDDDQGGGIMTPVYQGT